MSSWLNFKTSSNNELKEYSVIYTDRAVNLMSPTFVTAMQNIMTDLNSVYKSKKCALIPGSGTMGMEAVARQFGTNETCLIVRNGFFSYRWSQIFDQGNVCKKTIIHKADVDPSTKEVNPPNIDKVVKSILEAKPALVCLPHVETSVGVLVSKSYVRSLSNAVRSYGGLLCLDGIASGTVWADMQDLGVDMYITAPQKGWSSPASVGIVMLGQRALDKLETTTSSSFSQDLKKWVAVSDAYAKGGFMYHTTTPTDALITFSKAIKETLEFGLDLAESRAFELGNKFRTMLEEFGFKSVAPLDVRAPTVIVSYCKENMVPKFLKEGIMVAGNIPFMIDEPSGLMTFRIGLFGLDKLKNVDRTIEEFRTALKKAVN